MSNNSIEQLIKLLTTLLSTYQHLAGLADKQRLALIRRDIPALRQIVSQMEEAVATVKQTEAERERLVSALATEWDAHENLTLESLSQYTDAKTFQRLHSLGQSLRAVIQQLQHSNAGNHQLTQQSMTYIDKFFEILAKHTTVQNYGPAFASTDTYGHLALNVQA